MRSPDTACGCETKPSDQLLAFSLASPGLPETLPDGEAPLVVGANASGAGPPTAASAAVQLARRTAGFGPEWTRLAAHTSLALRSVLAPGSASSTIDGARMARV